MARTRTAFLLLIFVASAFRTAHAVSFYDPALRFRALPTEHFVIYFHQGEDTLARRLAAIAEETWRALHVPLGTEPPRRTHVVLVDQTERANGWATPVPYDTIMVTATWPPGFEFIGDTDDWLRMVFTHEFTHIVHLDRSESWARVIRDIFGRMEIAFPNLFLPQWHIEGLATYEESVITGYGRLHAGDFGAIVGEAALARRLEPLDRVNGGLTDWPNGDGAYAYGLGFHQYLADRFGAETLAKLADATARRVPFTASRVFTRIYGQSLGSLWRDYEASLVDARGDPGSFDSGLIQARQLTHHHYIVNGPRFDRPSCATCQPDVVYAVVTPDGFPSLNRVALDGTPPREITRRFLGSTTAIGSGRLYFDQQEVRRNTGLYSDLYAWSRDTGRVQQITSNARVLDPDLSPDGSTLACVQEHRGQRDLVLIPLTSRAVGRPALQEIQIETLMSEPDTQFNTPRWSPDGRLLALERHVLGSESEIARRCTNLFREPRMIPVKDHFLEDRLIHRTRRGDRVRCLFDSDPARDPAGPRDLCRRRPGDQVRLARLAAGDARAAAHRVRGWRLGHRRCRRVRRCGYHCVSAPLEPRSPVDRDRAAHRSAGVMRTVTVLGGGSWGTALAVHLGRQEHTVRLWARDPALVDEMASLRFNANYLPDIMLPANVLVTHAIDEALAESELVVVAVPSHGYRAVLQSAAPHVAKNAVIVSATKGLEVDTHLRMSQVIEQEIGGGCSTVVLSGPSFAVEVAYELPTAVLVASGDAAATELVQKEFRGPTFRLYGSDDVVGVEMGGAMKNIIAIAAGVVEGLGLGHNSLAALITRGLAEITRLSCAAGARRETLSGLSGLGDLVLTCTANLSRNRYVGVELARGRTPQEIVAGMKMVAEGVRTTTAALALGAQHGVELPIAAQMAEVLAGRIDVQSAINALMVRPQRAEAELA